MDMIFEHGITKFTRFYLKDLFTNELVECKESEFDELVIQHRDLYDMKYDGINAQVFLINGRIEARRERSTF